MICKACKFICKIPLQQKLRHSSENTLPVPVPVPLASQSSFHRPCLLGETFTLVFAGFLCPGKANSLSQQCLTVVSDRIRICLNLQVHCFTLWWSCVMPRGVIFFIVLVGIRLPLLDQFQFHQLVGIGTGIWGLQMFMQPKRKRAKFKGTLLNSVPGAWLLFS